MTCKNANTVWVVDAVRPTMGHYWGFSMFLGKCSTHSVININPTLKYTFSLYSKNKYFMIWYNDIMIWYIESYLSSTKAVFVIDEKQFGNAGKQCWV